MLRPLAGNREVLRIAGSTVGEVVDNLAREFPQLGERLVEDGQLRGSISVAIDGEVSTLGLLDRVGASSEVHFVPAIAGGTHSSHADTVG